jgi:hypothetical protein
MELNQMINIYISKSNEASIDDLLHVRTAIKKYPEFNILEHNGGVYDTKLVKKASIIIVIPNLQATNPMVVGKGVYSEAFTFEADYRAVYVGDGFVRTLLGGTVDDSTNWKKYGTLKINDQANTLEKTLQAILKSNNITIQSSNEKAAMQLAKNSTYGTNYNHLIEE